MLGEIKWTKHVISQNFFDYHICLYEDKPPSKVDDFCYDYVKKNKFSGLGYTVVMLTTEYMAELRKELSTNESQAIFRTDHNLFPPKRTLADVHYTSGVKTFTFIQCKLMDKVWSGQTMTNEMRFVPVEEDGRYKIDRLCFHPGKNFKGFRTVGPC